MREADLPIVVGFFWVTAWVMTQTLSTETGHETVHSCNELESELFLGHSQAAQI